MKVLGLHERTDYSRDIFGPSWLKFDELRYEHARKYGTNTKITSKPFEITEQKHEPGNNPSLMHHEAHAQSLHSAFPYSFPVKALWRFILTTHPQPAGTAQRAQDRKPAGCGLSSWILQLIQTHQKMSCCRDWRKGRKGRV